MLDLAISAADQVSLYHITDQVFIDNITITLLLQYYRYDTLHYCY